MLKKHLAIGNTSFSALYSLLNILSKLDGRIKHHLKVTLKVIFYGGNFFFSMNNTLNSTVWCRFDQFELNFSAKKSSSSEDNLYRKRSN